MLLILLVILYLSDFIMFPAAEWRQALDTINHSYSWNWASVAGIVDRKWTTAPASVVLLVRISRLNVLAILVKSAKTNLLSVPATNNLVAMGLGDRPQLEVKRTHE